MSGSVKFDSLAIVSNDDVITVHDSIGCMRNNNTGGIFELSMHETLNTCIHISIDEFGPDWISLYMKKIPDLEESKFHTQIKKIK